MQIINQPIGVSFPIERGAAGYFNQTFSVVDQIKANLTMLLKTKKGERRMNPGFGSGLWDVLFEFNNADMSQIVDSTVRRDIKNWMPYVNIVSVVVNNEVSEVDKYSVGVTMEFTVSGDDRLQTLDIYMKQGSL